MSPPIPAGRNTAWPLKIGLHGLLWLQRLLAALGLPAERALGRFAGSLSFRLATRRRKIARQNIDRCFPELPVARREGLLRSHFAALGAGLVELGFAWHGSDRRVRRRAHISGLEHVTGARTRGAGILLVSGHFTSLDLANRRVGLELAHVGVHRPFGIDVIDEAVHAGRSRSTSNMVAKSDALQALRVLKSGGILWITVDQADRGAKALRAPFFGIAANTSGTPARLSASSGCAVLPVYMERSPDGSLQIDIEACLEGFPSSDPLQDATRMNAVVEAHARRNPAQYYWIHRRFKSDDETFYAP